MFSVWVGLECYAICKGLSDVTIPLQAVYVAYKVASDSSIVSVLTICLAVCVFELWM